MIGGKVESIGTSKQVEINNVREDADYVSFDAPPLDFSFKNIKNLEELKSIQPRQGAKKCSGSIEEAKGKVHEEKEETEKITQSEEGQHKGEKKKNQVTRLLPQSNLNSVVMNLVNTSAMKNISLKAKEELQKKKKKKAIHVKLICSSLMLGYNNIRQLAGFANVMSSIMEDFKGLQWIDLSHNYLTNLDYDFNDFTMLKTIYLHCNYLADFTELEKLSKREQLKSFTIHGNPLTAIPNFRLLTISLLPQLKKLDSVLISKKQRDNALFIRSQTKKYPTLKNISKPPQEKEETEEQQKQ